MDNAPVLPEALDLIKAFERCKLTPYHMPGDVPTVGWGHTSRAGEPAVVMGQAISQEEADAIFAADVERFAAALRKLVTADLQPNQFGALVSLAYNDGPHRIPTLINRINRGDIHGAAAAFLLYVNFSGKPCAGLIRRRKAEKLMFEGDIAGALALAGAHDGGHMPKRIDPPKPPKTITQSKTGNVAGSIGAGAATIGTVIAHTDFNATLAAGKSTLDAANAVKEQAAAAATSVGFGGAHAIAIGLCLLIVLGTAFIWYDRWKKLHQDLV